MLNRYPYYPSFSLIEIYTVKRGKVSVLQVYTKIVHKFVETCMTFPLLIDNICGILILKENTCHLEDYRDACEYSTNSNNKQ